MVSIVICSVNDQFLFQVKKSIEETIGISYELLIWDNRDQQNGICEVYNKMAEKAQYPFLLFLHEDVSFRSINWGMILMEYFNNNQDIGMIGVAGSKYKSKMISGWYSGNKSLDAYNIIHKNEEDEFRMLSQPSASTKIHACVSLDGVFMMCRKSIWQQIRFDDQLLKGFHFYDIDFSIRASKICKLIAIVDVDLVHYTIGGDFGNKWIEQAFLYHRAHQNELPVSIEKAPVNIELQVAKVWLDWLKNQEITFQNRMRWVTKQRLVRYPSLWYSICKFMLYQPLRLQFIHQRYKTIVQP